MSEVDGTVRLAGHFAKTDTTAGNGITGRVVVDGVELLATTIAHDDDTGVDFSFDLDVAAGSTIDLIVDSLGTDGTRDDTFDSTTFTAVTLDSKICC